MPGLGWKRRHRSLSIARLSIGVALLSVAVLSLVSLSPHDASAHSITIVTPTGFGALDGSGNDHDGAANGTFSVTDGNLTIASGGSIACNDGASASACSIVINVAGDFRMECGSSIFAENQGGGGSGGDITIVAAGNITLAGACGGSGPIISSSKLSGAGDTGVAGDITILGTGGGSGVSIGSDAQVVADSRGRSGAITVNATKTVSVDGTVSSGYGRTGATTLSRGGPIAINAGCTLTVTGKISSRGQDPGGDLVHLQGCNVFIYGLVEAAGPGPAAGIPAGTVARRCYDADGAGPEAPNRPDKPSNSTACVEIWAGGTLTISSANGHNGEVHADTAQSGGTQGRGWVDLFARNDIIIEGGEASGVYNCAAGITDYVVHANQCLSGTGGVIAARTDQGRVTTSGNAIQADSINNGARGGDVVIESNLTIGFGTASVRAAGADAGGGSQLGGSISARSYNGQVVGSPPGALDTRESTSTPGGSVVLQACGSVGSTDGVQYIGATSPAATVLTNSCGGSPAFPFYVALPFCNCGPTPPPTPSPTPVPTPRPTPSPIPTPTDSPTPTPIAVTFPPGPPLTLSPSPTESSSTPVQTFSHPTLTDSPEPPPTPTPTHTPRATISHPTATRSPRPTPTPTETPPHTPSPTRSTGIGPSPSPRPAALPTTRPASVFRAVPNLTPSPTPTESPPVATPTPRVLAAVLPPDLGSGEPPPAVVPPPPVVDTVHPKVVRSVPTLADISISPAVVSTNFGLALTTLLVLLLTAAIINQTLKENERTLAAAMAKSSARLGAVFGSGAQAANGAFSGTSPLRTWGLPLLALAGAAAIYGLEEPGAGLNDRSLVLFLSYLGAFALITYCYDGTQLLLSRSYQVPAAIRVFPIGVVVAIFCVAVTRLTGFVPGLMYGFIAAHTLVGKVELTKEQQGKQAFYPAVALLAACVIAWLAVEPLRNFADDNGSWWAGVPEGIAVGVFVSGLQGLFFQMVPIRFMDGHRVFQWNKFAWLGMALVSGFLFWAVLINDQQESVSAIENTKSLVAMFIIFSCLALTILVYLLFRVMASRDPVLEAE